MSGESWHGTLTGYTSHKCRCDKCRATWAEYRRKYYRENREKELERGRKYYRENREKELEYWRKYRQENRDEIRERGRKYYLENREKELERGRKYYQENRGLTAGHQRQVAAREFSRGRAVASGTPWTRAEDLVVMQDRPLLELALALGRSIESARTRRRNLREMGVLK